MERNWKALCKLSNFNRPLMIAIATTPDDISEGALLRNAFPIYYVPEKGPIPLSVLMERSRVCYKDDSDCQPNEMLYQFLEESEEFPELKELCVRFRYGEDNKEDNLEKIPNDLAVSVEDKVGTTVEWRNELFVVLENFQNLEGEQLTLVPRSAVDPDL